LLGEHPALMKEHLALKRRVLSPRQHEVAWMLAWRPRVDLGMHLGCDKCSCRGSGPNGVHGLGGLLESLEACRRSVGHILWSTLAFGALLVDDITLELDMCTLGV
jgi:hypothetical protein